MSSLGFVKHWLTMPTKRKQVSSRGFTRLPLYFSRELLALTKFVALERLPMPPLSALGLSRFAQFERGDFDGITYIDTFFLKRHRVADERLHFHELIHVIQWRLLGPASFLAAYADGLDRFGYREGPLEMMAYNAESSFSQSPEIFDAEKLVAQRLRRINIPARMWHGLRPPYTACRPFDHGSSEVRLRQCYQFPSLTFT
jgi:hypothetical protein